MDRNRVSFLVLLALLALYCCHGGGGSQAEADSPEIVARVTALEQQVAQLQSSVTSLQTSVTSLQSRVEALEASENDLASVEPCIGIFGREDGRFVDNGDGTVTDTCTGLMWQKSTAQPGAAYTADSFGRVNWDSARQYAANLVLGGPDTARFDDWRLPNHQELRSLKSSTEESIMIDPVFETAPANADDTTNYWTSTVPVAPGGVPGPGNGVVI